MAIELNGKVDPAIQARLNDLDAVNHGQAQLLAEQFNSGAIDAVALDTRIQQAYSRLTASDTGAAFNASAARFGRVIPLRSEAPSRDAAGALAATAALPSVTGPESLEARAGIINSISAAIV